MYSRQVVRLLGLVILIGLLGPRTPLAHAQPRFQEILRLGDGRPLSISWNVQTERLAVSSSLGIQIYDGAYRKVGAIGDGSQDTYLLSWNPSGTLLAGIQHGHELQIWSSAALNLLSTMTGHTDQITSLAWSGDGTRIASASRDGTIRLWDAETGAQYLLLRGHLEEANALAWHPSDALLVSAGSSLDEPRLLFWNTRTGEQVAIPGGLRPGDPETWKYQHIISLAWSPDGTRIAAGNGYGLVVWDVVTRQITRTLSTEYANGLDIVAWSPDGRYVAGAAGVNYTFVWRAGSGEEVSKLPCHARSLAWSTEAGRLACVDYDETLQVWDVGARSPAHTFAQYGARLEAVAWDLKGARVAAASTWNRVQIWSASTGNCEGLLRYRPGSPGMDSLVWMPNALAWSHDGALLAASYIEAVQVWATDRFEPVASVSLPIMLSAGSLRWDQDGESLYITNWQGPGAAATPQQQPGWRLDVRTGETVPALSSTVEGYSPPGAWSSDASRLVVVDPEGQAAIWNTTNSQRETVLAGGQFTLVALAWQPDGAQLAGLDVQRGLLFWDTATGELLGEYVLSEDSGQALAWRPTGDLLAVADGESIMLWDATRREPVDRLDGHYGNVTVLAWNADGSQLASGGEDGTVRIWQAVGTE